MTEETLEDAYYRIARESAVWQERATRLQLTDAEREAIDWASRMVDDINRGDQARAATLRGLLERTQTFKE